MLDISVVIPLYNKGPHIVRAIDSVLVQTCPPSEIIVVDDGSTDGGYEAVAALDIPGLRLLQRSPPGPAGSAARNLGTEMATGDWVAFLDADDEWLPQHLESVVDVFSRASRPEEVAAVFSGYINVYPDGSRREDPFTRNHAGSAEDELTFSDLLELWLRMGQSPIWTSAVVIRRQHLLTAGLFPAGRCTRGEDKDTWLRVAHLGLCLPTKRVGAVYHRDAVNMATKLPYANQVPCIQHSIVQLLDKCTPAQQRLLRRLANTEIFAYARSTTKVETLRRDTWSGFFRHEDRLRALLLELMSMPLVSSVIRKASSLRRVR